MSTPLPHSPRVRVPGSTSNLGPGFDCLGLAIGLHVEVTALAPNDRAGHRYATRRGSAAGWSGGRDDLFLQAFERAWGPRGDEPGWVFDVRSEVPIARGLGSSGAAVAAGLLLGNALRDRFPSARELLPLGVTLEGHPDNVAASLFGGLTLCAPLAEAPGELPLLQPALHESLGVVVAWTSRCTTTDDARAVLPPSVPFADAVENPRRLALLLAGLERGDESLLRAGAHDRLHERYRLPLVPGNAEALSAMRAAGAPLATLSGSGSALVAIAPRERLDSIRVAARAALGEHSDELEARVVDVAGAARLSRAPEQ